jgi:acyl carrier protein
MQYQRFVTRVQVDASCAGVGSGDSLEKVQRLTHGGDNRLVFTGQRRIPCEFQPPVLGVMEVRESTVSQRAQIIQSQRRAFVSAQQKFGIRSAIVFRKAGAIDKIAAITRQCDTVPHFFSSGARLGILSGNTAYPHHRFSRRIDEDQAHLQQNFEFCGYRNWITLVEALCAITAVQQENFAASGLSQLAFERIDLPWSYQRRQARDSLDDLVELGWVRIDRLLLRCFAFATNSEARRPPVQDAGPRRILQPLPLQNIYPFCSGRHWVEAAMDSNELEMLEHIKWAVSKTNNMPQDAITLDTSFKELDFDSVDAISVAFALEDRLGIEIPGDDLKSITTIREFIPVLVTCRQQETRRDARMTNRVVVTWSGRCFALGLNRASFGSDYRTGNTASPLSGQSKPVRSVIPLLLKPGTTGRRTRSHSRKSNRWIASANLLSLRPVRLCAMRK